MTKLHKVSPLDCSVTEECLHSSISFVSLNPNVDFLGRTTLTIEIVVYINTLKLLKDNSNSEVVSVFHY